MDTNKENSLYSQISKDELFDKDKHNAYAFGVFWSAYQAKKLGYSAVNTIEFGVAGGAGLIAMEKVADLVEEYLEIDINVYGFDTGEGMPEPIDYRDLPYTWQAEQYKMDVEKLRNRLNTAELILGNIKETIPSFWDTAGNGAPIGFLSLDVDYYSSTKAALEILEKEDYSNCLPRTLMYFDDVSSTDLRYMCEDVGQLLAIKEWNEEISDRKIRKIHQLRLRRKNPTLWNELMYVCHSFKNPEYSKYIDWHDEKQLPI